MHVSKLSKLWARYGVTSVVGGTLTPLLLWLDDRGTLDINKLAIADNGVRSALFGALISVSGLFLTVWLAILAVVTTLDDDKPVVKLMKKHGQYEELVHRLVGPVFILLAVALLSVACILLPGTGADNKVSPLGWLKILPCATVGLSLGLFVQTATVARLLAHVLLFKPRQPGESDTAAAARERMARTEDASGADPAGAAAVALPSRALAPAAPLQ